MKPDAPDNTDAPRASEKAEKAISGGADRAIIDAVEIKRELARLRRQFNQNVDALERLIDRPAS